MSVNIGIIGCGYWGINYVRVFNELPESNVLAVCDKRADRLDYVNQRYPTVNMTSIKDILDDVNIDAVVVTTQAATHFEIAKHCLLSKKHVLIEKPMTTSVDEGEKLIELAEKTGKVLMVGHTFLYNSGIRKVKEIISSEDFGKIYYLYATRTNLGPIRSDVNAIWDLAPHDVSILCYFLNTYSTWVSAIGSSVLPNKREDIGFITLGYPDNIIGNIHVSWIDPNKVREVVVVGSKRRVVFNDLNVSEPVRVFEKGVSTQKIQANSFGEFQLLLRDGDIMSPKVEHSEPLKEQCRHFLDCIGNGQVPLTDGQNGLNVIKVMATVERSMRKNGAPMEVL